MSSRPWLSSTLILFAFAGPVSAQAPSPLELAPGIREAGFPDLALEYLKEIEPKLSPAEKLMLPLERAQCLLGAAEDEPDEGTRTSMVNEAKVAFDSFLSTNANHPRAAEAALARAKLTSVEAKAQLNRARRMDVPPKEDAGHEQALEKQRAEAAKARPLFLLASKGFADAAVKMKAKIDALPPNDPTRASLTRSMFDADLAAAVNEYYLADTFVVTGAKGLLERDKYLEQARKRFEELSKGPPTSRTVWIGKAWMAEVLADQAKMTDAQTEFTAILNSPRVEAEEGRRLVRFFQIRRAYIEALTEKNPAKLATVEGQLRSWLSRYGNTQKPPPEVIAARYYLAFSLQFQGMIALSKVTPDKVTGVQKLPDSARSQFDTAEKLYRGLSQSDHDYTDRSAKNRMYVVRRLLGEADKPVNEYPSFEAAQMAALIQMAKLNDVDKVLDGARVEEDDSLPFWAGLRQKGNILRLEEEAKDRKVRVVELLERARELATDRDSPADVTDNLLRLVYFYQTSNQPHQAAVLGEHIARTIRTTGGKGATAGLMALNGYTIATQKIVAEAKNPEQAEEIAASAAAARKADRERAIEFAKFLDQKFPNDTATDNARHRLAFLLRDDGKLEQAFQIITKIKPGYTSLLAARQFEGALASALINPKDKEGELSEARKKAIYRQAIGDLSRVVKPALSASKEDVQGYVGCRLRLAFLYLTQNRADKETEATTPGYDRALGVADELIAAIPSFTACQKDKSLSLEGTELTHQAMDLRTRSLYLRAKSLVDEKKFDDAVAIINTATADVSKPLYDAKMKGWDNTPGDAGDEEAIGLRKRAVAGLAAGIDRIRRDIVMVGFKLRCIQGNAAEAGKMLDLLKAAGGGIETNKDALEFMARDLALHITELKKEGKTKEAADLGAGLNILLTEFTNVKELPLSTILFLGQTFYTIGEWEKAIAEFRKVKPPAQPDWDKRKLEDFPQEIRGQLSKEIGQYRFAQLNIAKSLRGAAKLADAEKLLQSIIGTPEKQGFGYYSLDFRKELAGVFELKAAGTADTKAANAEWGKALKEWTTLFQFAQSGVKNLKPDSPVEIVKQVKSHYFDAYFEIQRVLATANSQLIKDPAKLATSFETGGKKILDLENLNKFNEIKMIPGPGGKMIPIKHGTEIISFEVWTRYCDLLDKYPALKAAYQKQGGKFFLERPKPEE
ncbi:MAG: hypothetical protein C0467_20700 [Planctomycetaceae bacterium]|nr:hypothetical protein [Planctomycetaceae bacterium]